MTWLSFSGVLRASKTRCAIMSWPCAHCFKPLRVHACVTLACGHGLHEECAKNLAPCGWRDLVCPECEGEEEPLEDGDDGMPWRTFWATEDSSGASQPAPQESSGSDDAAAASSSTSSFANADSSLPLPPAGWRRVAKLERRHEELSRQAEAGRQALASERRHLARNAQYEAGLKRDLGTIRAQLECCRERSLRSVVAHGAAQCHAKLVKAAGALEVESLLRELTKEHGCVCAHCRSRTHTHTLPLTPTWRQNAECPRALMHLCLRATPSRLRALLSARPPAATRCTSSLRSSSRSSHACKRTTPAALPR